MRCDCEIIYDDRRKGKKRNRWYYTMTSVCRVRMTHSNSWAFSNVRSILERVMVIVTFIATSPKSYSALNIGRLLQSKTSHSSRSLGIYVLRPFIHRRNRMNCAGLGRRQRFKKLQEGLIVLGLNGDVVGMFRSGHIGTQYLHSFLGGEVPLGPNSLSIVAPSLLLPGQFSGVCVQCATNIIPSPSFIIYSPR